MSNTFQRNRGATTCLYELEKRQLRVAIRGPMTPSVMPSIAEDINRIGLSALSRSIVVDVTGAIVALSYDELMASPELLVPVLQVLPISIVCSEGVNDLFLEHAWGAAKVGLVRGVFLAAGPAQQWAGQKGEILRGRTPESARLVHRLVAGAPE